MRRALICLLSLTLPIALVAQLSSRTADLKKNDGFIPFYWDEKKGDLLFELSPARLNSQLLHFTSLATGVGSTQMFADRSSLGGSDVIRFRRNGPRVLVIQENSQFRAVDGSPELKRAIEQSFATSVLASLPIEAEENGTLLVKANALIVRDAFGLLGQLKRPSRVVGGQTVRDQSGSSVNWRMDESRSGVWPENTKSFPRNTEVESLLTFSSDATNNDLGQPDAGSLTVHQHQSFVALPESGFEPIDKDPRVGYITTDFDDFSRPYSQLPARSFITRWRLQKKDPQAAMSEPVTPITFYLDRAIPEPVRTAARDGILWWNQAFEAAGFKNAVRVEDLPEGADPLDVRYSTIQWTSRNGRGWSVGMIHTDPRTGEILHSIVQLDSHRMRTVGNYWQAVVPPAKTNPMALSEDDAELLAAFDPQDSALTEAQVVERRLALLAAHEVGHVLGLDHNFVASTFDRGSVMEYFSPRVNIRPDGSFDLSDAYMSSIGSYDKFAINWGYSGGPMPPKTAEESKRRDSIVRESIAKGIVWGNYSDPRWNPYDDGPDPVANLKNSLSVRNALLTKFGQQLLHAGEPNSYLQSRFSLVYLYHRYAIGAAVNVVGGAKIPPSLKGDGQIPVQVWPLASQRAALDALLATLSATQLTISPQLWQALAPTEDSSNDPERFRSSAGYLFSPQDGARAISEMVVGGLLDAERIQRLKTITLAEKNSLSAGDLISRLVNASFSGTGELASVVQSVVAERLMSLSMQEGATVEVQAEAWNGLGLFEKQLRAKLARPGADNSQRFLAKEIELFKQDPYRNLPKHAQSHPPTGPPI